MIAPTSPEHSFALQLYSNETSKGSSPVPSGTPLLFHGNSGDKGTEDGPTKDQDDVRGPEADLEAAEKEFKIIKDTIQEDGGVVNLIGTLDQLNTYFSDNAVEFLLNFLRTKNILSVYHQTDGNSADIKALGCFDYVVWGGPKKIYTLFHGVFGPRDAGELVVNTAASALRGPPVVQSPEEIIELFPDRMNVVLCQREYSTSGSQNAETIIVKNGDDLRTALVMLIEQMKLTGEEGMAIGRAMPETFDHIRQKIMLDWFKRVAWQCE